MTQEGDPKATDQQLNAGLARREGAMSFPVPRALPLMDKIGFSPTFPVQVRTLNDVLVRVAPTKSVGFSMELTPDPTTPQVEFNPYVENPFKIEIAGIEEGVAMVRIGTREYLYGDGSVEFSDIQQFVRDAFPGKRAIFHSAPVIQFQGPVYIEAYRTIPKNLLEEERDPQWREVIQDSRRKSMERLLDGLLPTIDVDLDSLNEAQIERLAEKIDAIKVDATFYSRWSRNSRKRRVNRKEGMVSGVAPQLYNTFDIVLEGQSSDHPLLNISLFPTTYGKVYCVFQQLSYRGTPEEVEQVMKHFAEMMKKTPAYVESLETDL